MARTVAYTISPNPSSDCTALRSLSKNSRPKIPSRREPEPPKFLLRSGSTKMTVRGRFGREVGNAHKIGKRADRSEILDPGRSVKSNRERCSRIGMKLRIDPGAPLRARPLGPFSPRVFIVFLIRPMQPLFGATEKMYEKNGVASGGGPPRGQF